MNRRAFLKSYVMAASGLFVPRVVRSQAFTFFDPTIYSKPTGPCAAGVTAASNWAGRVVSNGGAAPSAGTVTAIANFVCALQAASIWTKMLAINVIAPDNLIAALTPLVVGGGLDPWTNHNFVSGDLTVNGLVGDASTKYLNTGVNAQNIGGYANSGGITIYYATNPNVTAAECGSNPSISTQQFALQWGTSSVYFDCYNYTTGRINTPASGFTGYISGNRTASNSEDIYSANSGTAHSSIVHGTGAPGGTGSNALYAWALNGNGTPFFYSGKRLSYIAIHSGLASSESLANFNAVQGLRTEFGGGFS